MHSPNCRDALNGEDNQARKQPKPARHRSKKKIRSALYSTVFLPASTVDLVTKSMERLPRTPTTLDDTKDIKVTIMLTSVEKPKPLNHNQKEVNAKPPVSSNNNVENKFSSVKQREARIRPKPSP